VGGRIPRLSTTLKRALLRRGVTPQSARYRAVFAAVGALDNLWILYRFDATHLDVLTVRDEPPAPTDEG